MYYFEALCIVVSIAAYLHIHFFVIAPIICDATCSDMYYVCTISMLSSAGNWREMHDRSVVKVEKRCHWTVFTRYELLKKTKKGSWSRSTTRATLQAMMNGGQEMRS